MIEYHVEVVGRTADGREFDAVYEPVSVTAEQAREAAIEMGVVDGLDTGADHTATVFDDEASIARRNG